MQNSNPSCQKLHVSRAKNETQNTISMYDDKEIVENGENTSVNKVNMFATCMKLLED